MSLFLLRSSEQTHSSSLNAGSNLGTTPTYIPPLGILWIYYGFFSPIIIGGICSVLSDLPCISAFCLVLQVPLNPTSCVCCRDAGLLSIVAFCINPGDLFIHSCRGCLTEDVRQILRVGSAPPPHTPPIRPAHSRHGLTQGSSDTRSRWLCLEV